MQEYISYDQLIQLIQLTQTQHVNQAQRQLSESAQNNPHLFNYLMQILKDNTLQHQIKLSTATYLNKILTDNQLQYSKQKRIEQLMTILQDSGINAIYKRQLQDSITQIIDILQQFQIKWLIEMIGQFMQEDRLRDTAYLLIGCLCSCGSVGIQHIVYIAKRYLMHGICNIILNHKIQLPAIKQYIQKLQIMINIWDRVTASYQIYLQNKDNNTTQQYSPIPIKFLYQISQSQQLLQLVLKIYPWMCDQMLYICTIQGMQQVNILKQKAAALHYRILKLYNTYPIQMKQNTYNKQVTVIVLTAKIIPAIINNMIVVINNQQKLQEYSCQQFIINLIKILTQYLIYKPNVFISNYKQLLNTIIFPLIKPRLSQKMLFQKNPIQYLSLLENCIEQQDYAILKSQICSLLQKVLDKIQQVKEGYGLINYIIDYCIDCILVQFRIPIRNVYDMEFVGMDIAVTVLCLLSYHIPKNKPKLYSLKSALNLQTVQRLPHYDCCLVYIFLSYNYSTMYANIEQCLSLIYIALQTDLYVTTKYCANDFICNVVDQYYSEQLLQYLCNKIYNGNEINKDDNGVDSENDNQQQGQQQGYSKSILNFIQIIIQKHLTKIVQKLMLQIIYNLFNCLQFELKKMYKNKNKQTKQTNMLRRILQIIQNITQNDKYCKVYTNVRQILWKVITILNYNIQLDIDDQVFAIVQGLVNKQDVIGDTSKQALGLILKYFAIGQYEGIHFYRILNHYILKSSVQTILPILQCILSGIIVHSNRIGQSIKKSHKSQSRYLTANLLLLLQNILAIHGKFIPQQTITSIKQIMIKFIPHKQDKIDSPIVLARVLNLLLLCNMFVKIEYIWYYLQIFVQKQVYNNYDIIVLLACVKEYLIRQVNIAFAAQMIIIITNAIRLYRKMQKLYQAAPKINGKGTNNKKFKFLKHKEYQQIIKQIQTPFKTKKKLQASFYHMLQSLRKTNENNYMRIISCINQQKIAQIALICEISKQNILNKKVKFTVLKPKTPTEVEQQMQNTCQIKDVQYDFKRKRMQVKIGKKLRGCNKFLLE